MFVYRDKEPPFGNVLIVDIDGVLADASAHQHFLNGETQNWEAFFKALIDSRTSREVQELVRSISSSSDIPVFLLTARPSYLFEMTVKWLDKNKVFWDALLMRDEGDERESPEIKLDLVRDLMTSGYKPELVLDDDPRNLNMFWQQKIPCVYVHSGYYEIDQDGN